MKHSLVLICPIDAVAEANLFLGDLGWPGKNFTVPLTDGPQSKITHMGLRATVETGFLQVLMERLSADPALQDRLISDARDDPQRHGHFHACLLDRGLQLAESVAG